MHNPIVKYSNTNFNDKQMDGFDGQPLLSNIPNIQILKNLKNSSKWMDLMGNACCQDAAGLSKTHLCTRLSDSCQTVVNIQE